MGKKRSASPQEEPRQILNEDGFYNQEEFVIPAQDDKGHSVRETIRISAELQRDIEIIIQSRKFPYKTASDLLRHGVVRHLEWLHRLEEGFPKHLLAAHQAQMDLLKEEEMRLASHLTFKKLHDQVEAYLASGEPGEARRIAAGIIAKLGGVADSAWKRRFEARFRRQYASLLDGDAVVMAGED